MSDLYPFNYTALQQNIAPLAVTAAEVHGGLCGYICAGGDAKPGQWLEQLCIDTERLPADAESRLESLRRTTLDLLDDPDMRFAPLLPDDESAMSARVQAMGEWCAGFLGGFGLTGTNGHQGLSEQARDALRDLDRIAQFGYEAGDTEEDETALTDILEYVRVAVLLLRQEAGQAGAPPDVTRH